MLLSRAPRHLSALWPSSSQAFCGVVGDGLQGGAALRASADVLRRAFIVARFHCASANFKASGESPPPGLSLFVKIGPSQPCSA
jgi:hypothetical protein